VRTYRFFPAALCMILSFRSTASAEPDAAELARELSDKATAFFQIGSYEEAAVHQKRALAIWRDLSATHKSSLAAAYFNLAVIYSNQGKLTAAQQYIEPARQLADEIGTPEERGRTLALAAAIHFQAGDFGDAEREVRAALPQLNGLYKATALNDLAMVRAALGDLRAARDLLGDSFAIREQAGAAPSPDHGWSLANLAWVLSEQGDFSAAAALYGRAIPMLEGATGLSQVHARIVLVQYARVLRKTGHKSEARAMERRAKAILGDSARAPTSTIDVRSFR
jgi:tetratricopeptide (TPR) repeat protein